jgi:chromate transport protein ChrA
MSIIYNIAFGIHILCVIAIVAMLLTQVKKSPKKLNPGVLHATLTALIAGVVMVGLFTKVNPDEVLNHTKFGVKGLVIAAILTLGYKNVKKDVLKNSVWASMLGLTILNILIASIWK